MAHYACSVLGDYPVAISPTQHHQYIVPVMPQFYLLGSPVLSESRMPYLYDEHEE